jgi:NAD(P)-dependent dehydrogenase (short-subunit alcohol dehydrogenase family)
VKRTYSSTDSHESITQATRQPVQSQSPLAPIGVDAALAMCSNDTVPKPKIFEEFSLRDRVALVSGGNRGIGLEAALALCEAGARAVYCLDLPEFPSADFEKSAEYVRRMDRGNKVGPGRLEYISADVRDQNKLWKVGAEIGDREGRMDVCVAAAGVLKTDTDCLEYPAQKFQEVHNVNVNGVLFTAQAAGRQMAKFGNGGSIILVGSISGSLTNRVYMMIST